MLSEGADATSPQKLQKRVKQAMSTQVQVDKAVWSGHCWGDALLDYCCSCF